VVTVADLDGNGIPDLVWQNDSTRQVVVWYMGGAQGNQYQGWAWLQASNTRGWTLLGAADRRVALADRIGGGGGQANQAREAEGRRGV
jgi:hypothetical protein